jgi:hypothetical protein
MTFVKLISRLGVTKGIALVEVLLKSRGLNADYLNDGILAG